MDAACAAQAWRQSLLAALASSFITAVVIFLGTAMYRRAQISTGKRRGSAADAHTHTASRASYAAHVNTPSLAVENTALLPVFDPSEVTRIALPITRALAYEPPTRTGDAPRGSIALVGAGPGSPDLLTLAAYRALACADVVICDRIAPPALRRLARAGAEFLTAAKLPGRADAAQEELNSWGIAALKAGKRVVRLKAGDPYLYGRGGEEFDFYASHGFTPDVIPGISSALAAPLIAGIPVTHRGVASQVLISTGHGRDGALPDLPAYDASRTLILLMAVGRVAVIRDQLLQRGYPGEAPVAIIERATHPDERCTRTTLGVLPEAAAAAGCAAPAVIVVGGVVSAVAAAATAAQLAMENKDPACIAAPLFAERD